MKSEKAPVSESSARFIEWARRRSGDSESRPILEELRAGRGDTELQEQHGLPRAFLTGVRSFYDLLHEESGRPCTGTACWLTRGASAISKGIRCYGRCYEAPADPGVCGGPIPRRALIDPPVVLRHLLSGQTEPLADYDLPCGEEVLQRLDASGLRGRGGAAFPTAAKWKTARDTKAADRYVVANGDEGDPGSYIDRLLLEEAPHSVLAGMKACARAISARRGVVFIRGEYPAAQQRMRSAIAEATAQGLLDDMHIEVFCGAGSYVAGEETALLRAIEGLRAEPWPKPPYPAQCGLRGLPTVVQNVETLSVIPWVVKQRRRGDAKAICLSGAVKNPGIVEIQLGTPLDEVLERGGGGSKTGMPFKMALVGGPLGRVLPASQFGTPLSYESLSGLGHGGVVVMDERTNARALALHLMDFAAAESCGSCAPCRIGTAQLSKLRDRRPLLRLLDTLEQGSLCGFGQGVPRPIRDLIEHFPAEMFPC